MSGDVKLMLSRRQVDVGRLIVDGKKSHEIGALLDISARTVEAHVRAIKSNLSVNSHAQMVVKLQAFLNSQRTSSEAGKTNIARPATRLIGRATELIEVGRALRYHRLVTLTGSPGVGKTRLALAVAEAQIAAFADGVWLIELASLSAAELVPTVIARIMGLALDVQAEPFAQILRALAAKAALFIFDNCEHVAAPIARTIESLVELCPNVAILCTTRERLRIGQEHVRLVFPLPTPEATTDPLSVERVAASPAVILFIERATAVNPAFSLSTENAAIVGNICRRLDGIPLAIELAAARLAILAPQQLHDALDHRFRLLKGGARDAPAHHETLQTAIDWSHNLLTYQERLLFRRLSIFEAGWTNEAAQAVSAVQQPIEIDATISSLVEKSLITAALHETPTRYRMLESIRDYAAAKLASANERELSADRHLTYYRNLFVDAEARYVRSIDQRIITALAVELENARRALEWAIRTKRITIGAELFATTSLWYLCGLHDEASTLADELLALNEADDTRIGALLWGKMALACYARGDIMGAFTAASRAADNARLFGDPLHRGIALSRYGLMATNVRKFETAKTAFDEADAAYTEFEASGEPAHIYRCALLETRSRLEMLNGELDRAAQTNRTLLKLHRSLGNSRAAIITMYHLAHIEHVRGNTVSAIQLATNALLETDRRLANEVQASADDVKTHLLIALGAFLAATDDAPGASDAACQAIRLLACGKMVVRLGQAIVIRALALMLSGRPELAARLAGFSLARMREADTPLEPTEQRTHERLVALLRERFAPTELSQLLAQGEGFSQDEAITAALPVG